MDSTVRLRPNHYEVLGLAPDASSDEIAQAFATAISLFSPRPFDSLTEVSIAYETLRDSVRRRAYDASLGLSPEPKSEPAPGPVSASAKLMERLAADPPPPPGPKPNAHPRPEPSAQPETSPFMAAPPRTSEAAERVKIEPHFSGDRAPHRRFKANRVPIRWNRPALAAGALIGSAALLGAWVGLEAGNDNQAEQADRTVTTKLPPATALPIATASLSAPVPAVADARPVVNKARIARAEPPLQINRPEEPQPEAAQLEGLEAAPEQVVAESPAAEATAARLPLPNAVIARTIGRIGYACGQVASTTAIDGAPGAFKVTCTSGHSYRAAPVRGRYRFKRL